MDDVFKINLNDALRNGTYTVEQLSDMYLEALSAEVLKLQFFMPSMDIDSFNKLTEVNECFKYVSLPDLKNIYDLKMQYEAFLKGNPVGRRSLIPGGMAAQNMKNAIRKYTDIVLARKIANDMYNTDERVSNKSYIALQKLGYDPKEYDRRIPEVVRGNYKLFLERETINSDIRVYAGIIDRIQYIMEVAEKYHNPRKKKNPIIKPIEKVDTGHALFILGGDMPISKVRSGLTAIGGKPFQVDINPIKEIFENISQKNAWKFDVYDVVGKTTKEMLSLSGEREVTEADYKTLISYGFSGKDSKPILRSGRELFKDVICYRKSRDIHRETAQELSEKVLENSKIRDIVHKKDPKSNLSFGKEMALYGLSLKYGFTSIFRKLSVEERKYVEYLPQYESKSIPTGLIREGHLSRTEYNKANPNRAIDDERAKRARPSERAKLGKSGDGEIE